MQPATAPFQGLHRRAFVNAATVEQDDHLTVEMTEQGDIGNVLARMQMQLEADPVPSRTDGHGRNRRDLVEQIAVPDDRLLASGRPRPPDVRDQQEPALVGKHLMGLQALRFFYRDQR